MKWLVPLGLLGLLGLIVLLMLISVILAVYGPWKRLCRLSIVDTIGTE